MLRKGVWMMCSDQLLLEQINCAEGFIELKKSSFVKLKSILSDEPNQTTKNDLA